MNSHSFRVSFMLILLYCFSEGENSPSTSLPSSGSSHRLNRRINAFIQEWNDVNLVLETYIAEYKHEAQQQITPKFEKTRPFETGVGAHFGKLKVTLSSEEKSSVLIYVPTLGTNHNLGKRLLYQIKEKYMYESIFPLLYNSWPHETWSPSIFHSTPSIVLIIENLRESGYYTSEGPRHDLTMCLGVVRSLARLHALSIHLAEQLSSSVIDILTVSNVAELFASDGFYAVISRKFRQHVIPLLSEEMRKDFEHMISNLHHVLVSAYSRNADGLNVLIHGDPNWTNIFFKNNDRGRPINCKFIDFRSSRRGSPVIDLVNYLMTSVDIKVYGKFGKTIFKTYLDDLKEMLEELKYADPNLLKITNIHTDILPVYYAQGVVGDRVNLLCDITIAEGPHQTEDSVVLVFWYRDNLETPIYSVDVREREYKNADRWSDDKIFGPRAYFVTDTVPAQLSVDNIQATDEGTYRCRVDFKFAQTRNSKVILTVIVPPQKIIIQDENGTERTSVVGPYKEGTTLALTCTVIGANPPPQITWLRENRILNQRNFTSMDESWSLDIRIPRLGRSDLLAELTCHARNAERASLDSVVQIDMNFPPVKVEILEANQVFTAGREYELICQAPGSRPPASVTWWLDKFRTDQTKETTSTDGNTTTSVFRFVPTKQDTGKYLSCRAENPHTSKKVLETGWKLEINYLPEVRIVLGKSLKSDSIREGADVYFDCIVDALPPAIKVEWKLNGRLLHHHIGHGIIISNRSLVLQRVSRNSAGNYTCKAYNTEGEGESNGSTLNVLYAPTCKVNQTRVYGVAKNERVNITCEVDANPTDLVYKWSFNNSQESVDVLASHITKSGTTSIVSHTPVTDMDYGTLLCIASNGVGYQRIPCIYHIIAAGKPERVSNCSVWNVTATSFSVRCTEGYNGGMPQTFYSEANTESDHNLKSNISVSVPRFQFAGLQPGTRYVIAVYAVNIKGRSEPYLLEVTTLENPEKTLDLKEAEKPESRFQMSTTMTVVIIVVLVLIGIACLVATGLQCYCNRMENLQNKDKFRDETNVYSSNDSMSSGEKNRDGYIVDKIITSQNSTLTIDGEEREPDLIAQATSDIDERRDYIHRRQHVSTIEAEIPVMQNLFASNTMNRNYPSYCTLRNGTMPLQNFSHLNKTNIVIAPNDHHYALNSCTLQKKSSSLCVPSTSDGYRYPTMYRTSTPLHCTIPEEEHSPSATPLISPKQESAV